MRFALLPSVYASDVRREMRLSFETPYVSKLVTYFALRPCLRYPLPRLLERHSNIALSGDGRLFPGFKHDLETFGPFENNVSLQSEVGFLDIRFDAEISHNCGENNLEFEHSVLATHARTRPSRERHEGVVMAIGSFLG